MVVRTVESLAVERRASARVSEVAQVMGTVRFALAHELLAELVESIPELCGDSLMLELLRASTESNVDAFLQVAEHTIPIQAVSPPPAAAEYARRLAQRGISLHALMRAYRLAQRRVQNLALDEIARQESDGEVALRAAQLLQAAGFAYVDRVAEAVVAEYESERERWLANRNIVRSTVLTSLLNGRHNSGGLADETALGYKLGQRHLGVVAWTTELGSAEAELRSLEALVALIAERAGARSQPLFIPQDRSLGWGWIPLGHASHPVDLTSIRQIVVDAHPRVRLALGTSAAGVSGFRSTHLEALRAYAVASIAAKQAAPITTYGDPGVVAASLFSRDMEATRDLVRSTLGALVSDNEATATLRSTLLEFLTENRSHVAAAKKLHVHKNTVKYRITKAAELRGRPLDEDRLNLELALHACRWLGRAVLPGG